MRPASRAAVQAFVVRDNPPAIWTDFLVGQTEQPGMQHQASANPLKK